MNAPSTPLKSLLTTTQVRAIDVRDDTLALGDGPYERQQELIDHQLSAVRRRLRVARQHFDNVSEHDRATHRGFSDVVVAESHIAARVRATRERFPIKLVRDRFALTDSEDRVLWLLIAHELCPVARQRIRELVTEHVWDPTLDVIRRVVYGPRYGQEAWRELGTSGTLRRFGLIERSDQGNVAEYRTTWRLPPRLLALVHEDLGLDPLFWDLGSIVRDRQQIEDLELSDDVALKIETGLDRGDVVLTFGPKGSGRRSSLVAIAQRRGLTVLDIDCRLIARDRLVAEKQVMWIARECQLLGLTPLLSNLDALVASGDASDRIELVERAVPHLFLATSTRPIARRWMCRLVSIELRNISAAQRARLWRRAISSPDRNDAEILARMHPIAPAMIEAAGHFAVRQCGTGEMEYEHIADGIHALLRDRFCSLAKPLALTQSWDEFVLHDDQMALIVELLRRMREHSSLHDGCDVVDTERRAGLPVLFSGPPGTGKTTAATCLTRALQLEIYQAEFGRIVSNRSSETERNIATLFDIAEAGRVVLLLDNVDSLCEEYPTIRPEYLCERIESYAGICILTARNEDAIDARLKGRMLTHIAFPVPEPEERERLWRAMIPSSMASRSLGLDALAASYDMSGGHIRNAVLRALRLAAEEGEAVEGKQLARAALVEYASLGKLIAPKR